MSTHEPQGVASTGWRLFAIDLDEPLGDDRGERVHPLSPSTSGVSWSPDGRRFVAELRDVTYDLEWNPIYGPADLYAYDLDRLEEFPLALNTEAEERAGAWSPDGEWIAYLSDVGGVAEIQRWPVAGGASQRIVTAPCEVVRLQWLGDGDRLLAHCTHEIAVLDIGEGSVVARYTGTSASPSPDGTHLVVEQGTTIAVIDIHTSEITDLGAGRSPAWRPR